MNIKPCPFCGNKQDPAIFAEQDEWIFVSCDLPECSADGPARFNRTEAIEAWNERKGENK